VISLKIKCSECGNEIKSAIQQKILSENCEVKTHFNIIEVICNNCHKKTMVNLSPKAVTVFNENMKLVKFS